MRTKWFPYLVLLPTLIFLFAFTYLPLLRSLVDSLYDTRLNTNAPAFVGIDNFIRLWQDAVFWRALRNNLLYILLTVAPGVLLALFLAVMLWENTPLNRWMRTAFFFPMIVPLVSVAMLWLFIFMPGLGLLDYYLAQLFGPMNNNYLGMSDSALLAVSAIGIWKFAGYYMLFFLAGLQAVSSSAREAAVMEGASKWQVFFHVTLPLLRPTIAFVVTIAFIYAIT